MMTQARYHKLERKMYRDAAVFWVVWCVGFSLVLFVIIFYSLGKRC